VRKRVFYLFYRFVQVLRIDIETQHVPPILQAIQDLLTFEVEIPEDTDDDKTPPPANTSAQFRPINVDKFLADALKPVSMFDSQLYMFEAAGALISILWSLPESQAGALQAVINPLLTRLSTSLQTPLTGTPEDYVNILAIHHCIRALGSIPKGFPEFPSPVPPGYVMPPLVEFRQMAEAILVSLDIMGRFKVVREAVSFIVFVEYKGLFTLPSCRLASPSGELYSLLGPVSQNIYHVL
jgi:exportin-T